MAFVAASLAPVGRLAPLYRGAGDTELAELADLVAAFGSGRLEAEALRRAAETAREAALRALSRRPETAAGQLPGTLADREAKVALRRLFSVAAPALRLQLAVDASRWISSQGGTLPLSTLSRTPYEEMLPSEMELLENLVSAYLEEGWFRDGRYREMFATVPEAFLAFLGPVLSKSRGGDWLLRATGSALIVPPLERLDQLHRNGEKTGEERTVAEVGRRIADWAEKVLAEKLPTDMMQLRRSSLERLRSRHEAELDALLHDLRGRLAHATRSV